MRDSGFRVSDLMFGSQGSDVGDLGFRHVSRVPGLYP